MLKVEVKAKQAPVMGRNKKVHNKEKNTHQKICYMLMTEHMSM